MPYLKAKHLSASLRKINEEAESINRRLIYTGGEVRFHSETGLQDFIEQKFQQMFPDLDLVKHQYIIKTQRF